MKGAGVGGYNEFVPVDLVLFAFVRAHGSEIVFPDKSGFLDVVDTIMLEQVDYPVCPNGRLSLAACYPCAVTCGALFMYIFP